MPDSIARDTTAATQIGRAPRSSKVPHIVGADGTLSLQGTAVTSSTTINLEAALSVVLATVPSGSKRDDCMHGLLRLATGEN